MIGRHAHRRASFRAAAWLALGLAVAMSADLVEDAIEALEAVQAAADRAAAEAADDVTVAPLRLAEGDSLAQADSPAFVHPVVIGGPFVVAAVDLTRLRASIHGLPRRLSDRSSSGFQPLRI